MNGVPRRAWICGVAIVAGLAAGASLSPATAAAPEPEGIAVGPWILAPSLIAEYTYDTNVFLNSRVVQGNVLADHASRMSPALRAALPFGDSRLTLDYKWTKLQYGSARLERDVSQEGGVALTLGFSTQDRLSLSARKTLGIAETSAFDPGGEVVFKGAGFNLATYQIEAAREVYGQRGYRVQLLASRLRFPQSQAVSFFEFSGFTGVAEYREPLSPSHWVVVSFEGRRYDHTLSSGEPPDTPREESDLIMTGLRGQFGKNESYSLQLGWADFRFPGSLASNFRGFVADASATQDLGRTRFILGLGRRPWPSFLRDNNYYVVDRLGVKIERHLLGDSLFGVDLTVYRSTYGDPTTMPTPTPQPTPSPETLVRRDRTFRGELYATLMIRDRVGFHLSVVENRRSSNYQGFLGSTAVGADFSGRAYFAGFVFGWM